MKPVKKNKNPKFEVCRHCKKRPGNRRRGLCRACWEELEIRCLYDSLSIYGRRGGGNDTSKILTRRLPEPTDALPGTEEKIRVLMGRVERNEHLHHKLDRRRDEELDWRRLMRPADDQDDAA